MSKWLLVGIIIGISSVGNSYADSNNIASNASSNYLQSDYQSNSRELRIKARNLLLNGSDIQGYQTLEKALAIALKIEDDYTRANHLRYLGKIYGQNNQLQKSRVIFRQALDITDNIKFLDRRLSGIIGIIEAQNAINDSTGLRDNLQILIHKKLFHDIAQTGKTGETNRLLSNFNGHLHDKDVISFMGYIATNIDWPLYRKRVYYKLNEMTIDSSAKHYQHANDIIDYQSFSEITSDPLEKILILSIIARIYKINGQTSYMNQLIQDAVIIAKKMPAHKQYKAQEIINKAIMIQ